MEKFASHRLLPPPDRRLQDLRKRIASLDLAEVEAQIGFTIADVMGLYETDLAGLYPLAFGHAREFLIQLGEQMAHSEVGAFLLAAQGCDWRTTDLFFDTGHRAAIQRRLDAKQLPLFDYLLFYIFPAWRATHERFAIFQAQTQPYVRTHAIFASLPCGRMRDLLTLDFSALSKGLHLIGIDKDPAALRGAQALSEQVVRDNPAITIEFRAGDALRAGITMPELSEQVDLLTSNGLNIYLTDAECLMFYTNVYHALKPGGVFITSHLVPPKEFCQDRINRRHLQLQTLVWNVLVNPLWESFLKSRHSVRHQLHQVGFRDFKVIPDSQGIFPTFLAIKP